MRSVLLLLSTALSSAGAQSRGFFDSRGGVEPLYRKVRCFSCSSINATAIVGGAGVDPGVFLSTIRLGAIPITERCRDDFEAESAVRAGAATPVCEDGLCVKINYTDKLSGKVDVLRACLPESQGVFKRSCARFSSSQVLSGAIRARRWTRTGCSERFPLRWSRWSGHPWTQVRDESWRRWLMNVRYVPRAPSCGDAFIAEDALRAGARSQPCEDGVCMKMWFQETGGSDHVWRSCIPNAAGSIRSDCTRISSGEGDMEVCTCSGNLCNGATIIGSRVIGLITFASAVIQLFS